MPGRCSVPVPDPGTGAAPRASASDDAWRRASLQPASASASSSPWTSLLPVPYLIPLSFLAKVRISSNFETLNKIREFVYYIVCKTADLLEISRTGVAASTHFSSIFSVFANYPHSGPVPRAHPMRPRAYNAVRVPAQNDAAGRPHWQAPGRTPRGI